MLKIFNSTLAFLSGLIGFGILYLLLEAIAQMTGLDSSFIPVGLILFGPIYEELGKYFSIKIWKITNPYAIFLGLGWSAIESFSMYVNKEGINLLYRINPTLLHILTSVVLVYFITRKKPVRGLIIAIILHIVYNIIFS